MNLDHDRIAVGLVGLDVIGRREQLGGSVSLNSRNLRLECY